MWLSSQLHSFFSLPLLSRLSTGKWKSCFPVQVVCRKGMLSHRFLFWVIIWRPSIGILDVEVRKGWCHDHASVSQPQLLTGLGLWNVGCLVLISRRCQPCMSQRAVALGDSALRGKENLQGESWVYKSRGQWEGLSTSGGQMTLNLPKMLLSQVHAETAENCTWWWCSLCNCGLLSRNMCCRLKNAWCLGLTSCL